MSNWDWTASRGGGRWAGAVAQLLPWAAGSALSSVVCAHLYSMDFDELLKEVGAFGLYQKIIICSVLLPAALPCAFHAYRWVTEWKSNCILPYSPTNHLSFPVSCSLQPRRSTGAAYLNWSRGGRITCSSSRIWASRAMSWASTLSAPCLCATTVNWCV